MMMKILIWERRPYNMIWERSLSDIFKVFPCVRWRKNHNCTNDKTKQHNFFVISSSLLPILHSRCRYVSSLSVALLWLCWLNQKSAHESELTSTSKKPLYLPQASPEHFKVIYRWNPNFFPNRIYSLFIHSQFLCNVQTLCIHDDMK